MSSQLKAVIFAAAIVGSAAIWNTCPRGPVGSCLVMGCSQADGPTVCENHQCICDTGYCRYPNSRLHLQPRRCRAQVPDSSCHGTRFCYKGGLTEASCVSGRCLCRTGMHINQGGVCASGYWPDESHCNKDTGGSCKVFGCAASRGPTTCTALGWESGTGHQCHCKDGWCATKGGTCRRQRGLCTKQTGGTCRWLGCSKSRNSVCQSGKCVCPAGTCVDDGKCIPMYDSLSANATLSSKYFAVSNAAVEREEDWEITVNMATGVVVMAMPFALILGGVLVIRRIMGNRKVAGNVNEKLLHTEE